MKGCEPKHYTFFSFPLCFFIKEFTLDLCRSIACASEAAKAGIPLGHYEYCSQVCTHSKHKKVSFSFGVFEYYMFGESTPLIDVHAFGFDWNQRILKFIRI